MKIDRLDWLICCWWDRTGLQMAVDPRILWWAHESLTKTHVQFYRYRIKMRHLFGFQTIWGFDIVATCFRTSLQHKLYQAPWIKPMDTSYNRNQRLYHDEKCQPNLHRISGKLDIKKIIHKNNVIHKSNFFYPFEIKQIQINGFLAEYSTLYAIFRTNHSISFFIGIYKQNVLFIVSVWHTFNTKNSLGELTLRTLTLMNSRNSRTGVCL